MHDPVSTDSESQDPITTDIRSHVPATDVTQSHVPATTDTQSNNPATADTRSHVPATNFTQSHVPAMAVSQSHDIDAESPNTESHGINAGGYKCQDALCENNRSFKSQRTLQIHENKFHRMKCHSCDLGFQTAEELAEHEETHVPPPCNHPHITFTDFKCMACTNDPSRFKVDTTLHFTANDDGKRALVIYGIIGINYV